MSRARIPFVRFCTEVLRLTLSPAWRVLLSIAVDRVEPATLTDSDRAIVIQIFGVDVGALELADVVRRTLVWRLGRGSGKTTIAAALAVWAAVTADLSTVGPGMIAASVIVAPTLRTAKIALRVARELVRASKLERLIAKGADSTEAFDLIRPDGRRVSFVTVSASRGGHTLRGFDIVSLILDESEFFSSAPEAASADVHVSDRDLVAAATARLHGSMILISTPWPVETLTSELVERNYGSPRDALVAIGPSTMMRPDDRNLADRVALEMDRDPDTARREFFCEAIAGSGSFFDVADVEACIAVPSPMRSSGAPCIAAIDVAFVKDHSALVILERRPNGQLAVVHLDEVRPTKGSPIVLSLLVGRWAPIIRAHGCARVYGDTFCAAPIGEELGRHGLRLVPITESRDTKSERYLALRAAFVERRIALPHSSTLLAGLRSVVAKPMPGGAWAISAARRAGGAGHADAVSALVLAVHAARRSSASYGTPSLVPILSDRGVGWDSFTTSRRRDLHSGPAMQLFASSIHPNDPLRKREP